MVNEKIVREHYKLLTEKLIEKGLSITTMESATSGQIASLITDTQGASAIMKGAFITYSNEAKISCGVPAEIIDEYGVYSNETSHEMARAAKAAYLSDIAVSVTGTMGNVDPVNMDSIPGEVYFSIAFSEQIKDYHISMEAENSRLMYKLAVADAVYEELMKVLED